MHQTINPSMTQDDMADSNSDKKKVRAYFNQVFDDYAGLYDEPDDLSVYPSGLVRLKKAIDLVCARKTAGRVLDLGCGSGPVALELAKHGFQVTGIDIAEKMVEVARARATEALGPNQDRLRFEVGDVDGFEAEPNSQDVVIALGLLEYLPDEDAVVRKINALLADDGIVVLAFRNRLFNLFSFNQMTEEEIRSGTYDQLLAEYRDALAQGMESGSLAHFAAASARSLQDLTTSKTDDRGTTRFRFKHPIKLRQRTPREARALAERHGLVCEALHFYHFHPFPPVFEQANPEVFNRIALDMEALDQSPIGSVMASAFLTVLRRREEA